MYNVCAHLAGARAVHSTVRIGESIYTRAYSVLAIKMYSREYVDTAVWTGVVYGGKRCNSFVQFIVKTVWPGK